MPSYNLSYPPNVDNEDIPYVFFKARPYETAIKRVERGSADPETEQTFRIAMSPQLTSSDSFNYESTSLLKTQALASLANGDIGDSVEAAIGAALARFVPDGIQQSTQLLSGKSINPKEELLFKNPNLRSHTFTFNLFAKSESEAQTIVNIVREFRRIAYPDTTTTPIGDGNVATFFQFPYQFAIGIHPQPQTGMAGNGFPPIPAAVCTSVETNFAGGGRTVLTKGNYFQAIDLTLTFQDIRVMTSEKINGKFERDGANNVQ